MDMGIVNAGQLAVYEEIPPELRERVEDVILNRRPDATERLLEIARCLATEPTLLLLDEPAAGLNLAETDALGRLILSLRRRGITILLVEHLMDLVMGISDSVLVLNYGQVLAYGSPEAVQNNPAVIEAYLGVEVADA